MRSIVILVLACFLAIVTAQQPRHAKSLRHKRESTTGKRPSPGVEIRKRADSRRCAASSSSVVPSATSIPTSAGLANAALDTSTAQEQESTQTAQENAGTAAAETTTQARTTTKTSTTSKSTPTSSSSSSSGTNTGEATFYDTGLGACGITNSDNDYIVAVSTTIFDNYPGYNGANPNNNPICNKQIQANYNGKSVIVTVTDRCGGCAEFDLDFSPDAFDQLADQSLGRLEGMTWSYV